MRRRPHTALFVPAVLLAACAWLAGQGQPELQALLAAEAARAGTAGQLDLLRSAARTGSAIIQRTAIRALGRLERPALVPDLLPLLDVADPGARAEAANALAQAAGQDLKAAAAAREALVERLPRETDENARAAQCEALGRLPFEESADGAKVERLLVDETAKVGLRGGAVGPASPLVGLRIGWGKSRATSTPAAVGALRGLESLLRLRRKVRAPSGETVAQLRELTRIAATPARRLALLALNAVGGADEATIDAALKDDDVEVRRLAASASGASATELRRAVADKSPVVRYEALRAWGRRLQAEEGCGPVLSSVKDGNPHVVLLALDLLGSPCKAGQPAAGVLKAAAGPDQGWHERSHAVAALARISPDAARPLLPGLLAAEFWVARVYAARAAASLNDLDALRRLADDPDANVCEAAIASLAPLAKHAADAVYVRALQSSDGQLLMTAARALEGTPDPEPAVRALLSALDRLTKADSDPTRDPRLALLDRLRELGTRESAPALEPLLADVDPRVADRAAAVLTAWTGEARAASPRRRPPQPAPTDAELASLSQSIVRVTMKGGGQFDIRLLTDLAPLSSAAFARLVASGYYNGLSIHRVEPNFVVQGGSPGANEYAGAPRYMLDEVGRTTQARGTVGTSTRGRDTGDGQFYVNLVNNPRLDHEYTIFGEVTRGMEKVDAILEGDRIERAEVVPAERRK